MANLMKQFKNQKTQSTSVFGEAPQPTESVVKMNLINKQKLESARNVRDLVNIQLEKVSTNSNEGRNQGSFIQTHQVPPQSQMFLQTETPAFRHQAMNRSDLFPNRRTAATPVQFVEQPTYLYEGRHGTSQRTNQFRSRSQASSHHPMTADEQKLKELFDRGSQVETVRALKQIYDENQQDRKAPKLNYIMERYAQKKRGSCKLPELGQIQRQSVQEQDSHISFDQLDDSTLASQKAQLESQIELQKQITQRLQSLKEIFELEEKQKQSTQNRFSKSLTTSQQVESPDVLRQSQRLGMAILEKNAEGMPTSDNNDSLILTLKEKSELIERQKTQKMKEGSTQQTENIESIVKNRHEYKNPKTANKKVLEKLGQKTETTLGEGLFIESKVSNIVPFNKPGAISELEKNVAMRINSQNKNFVIEGKEREQAVRIRKEQTETEQRVKKQLEDEQRESRLKRNKDKKKETQFVAVSFMQFMDQQERKEERAKQQAQKEKIEAQEENVLSDQPTPHQHKQETATSFNVNPIQNITDNEMIILDSFKRDTSDLGTLCKNSQNKGSLQSIQVNSQKEIKDGFLSVLSPIQTEAGEIQKPMTSGQENVNTFSDRVQTGDTISSNRLPTKTIAQQMDERNKELENSKGNKLEGQNQLIEVINDPSTNVTPLPDSLLQNQQSKSQIIPQIKDIRPHTYDNAFSQRRFNRFPRFAAVIKGQTQAQHLESKTVNLNCEIGGENIKEKRQQQYIDLESYDPFERVVLFKDIDNQVLTSFRTLKGENNGVSETHKIIHRKFLPISNCSHYMKIYKAIQSQKQPYYNIGEIEEKDEEYIYIPEDDLHLETPGQTTLQEDSPIEKVNLILKTNASANIDLQSINKNLTKENTHKSEIHLDQPVPLAQVITKPIVSGDLVDGLGDESYRSQQKHEEVSIEITRHVAPQVATSGPAEPKATLYQVKKVNPLEQFTPEAQTPANIDTYLSNFRATVTNALFPSTQQRNPYKNTVKRTIHSHKGVIQQDQAKDENLIVYETSNQEQQKQNEFKIIQSITKSQTQDLHGETKTNLHTDPHNESVITNQKQDSQASQLHLQPIEQIIKGEVNVNGEKKQPKIKKLSIPQNLDIAEIGIKVETSIKQKSTSNSQERATKPRGRSLGETIKEIQMNRATVTEMINDIYRKERQYIPSFDKDNILSAHSAIFELSRLAGIKSNSGVEEVNQGMREKEQIFSEYQFTPQAILLLQNPNSKPTTAALRNNNQKEPSPQRFQYAQADLVSPNTHQTGLNMTPRVMNLSLVHQGTLQQASKETKQDIDGASPYFETEEGSPMSKNILLSRKKQATMLIERSEI